MNLLLTLKRKTEILNYGRSIIVDFARQYQNKAVTKVKILDLGAGKGTDLQNIASEIAWKSEVDLYAVECYEPNVLQLQKSGIHVKSLIMRGASCHLMIKAWILRL